MAEKSHKSGKFFTTILIGGALGSLLAWLFGSKKRREQISEKAHEYTERVDVVLHPEKKRGFFSRIFGRKSS